MRALVLHGKGGDYRYEPNWPEPSKSDGWAVVRVAYCGVCGSDIPRFASAGSYHHPMILGHEFSGIVHKPANAGSILQKGDPVAISPIIPCGGCDGCRNAGAFHCTHYQFLGSRNDGGFAEYCAVPEKNLIKLESKDILKAGCLIEPMAVALHTIRRSCFKPGKCAVVFGAGPIGLIIGILLREFGAEKVIMADLKSKKIDMASDIGFETVNLAETGIKPVGKVDFAFEAAGSAKAVSDAVSVLKAKGVLTVVGRDITDTVIALDIFEAFMRKEISLLGCWGYDIAGEEAFIAKMLGKYKSELENLISHVVALENSGSVISDMCNQKFDYCKVAISI